jgi:hypothetical protein
LSSDILSLIDNAIDHYAVGPDAMRWSPDAPTVGDCPEPPEGVRNEPLAGIGGYMRVVMAAVTPVSYEVLHEATAYDGDTMTVRLYSNSWPPHGEGGYHSPPAGSAVAAAFDAGTFEWSAVGDSWRERIAGLRDASVTISGYYDPGLSAVLFGNAYIVDEMAQARAAKRDRLRRMHSCYSRRVRARRRR